MFNRESRLTHQHFHSSKAGMYYLLSGLLVVILPHTLIMPAWISLLCLSLLMWRLLCDLRKFPMPNKIVIYLMFLLIILGVLSHYFTIVGREAGTALLVSLICLKLFEIKSYRDISVIVQLSFFAIVVTFLFSQSILVALAMMLAVVLLVASLVSFQHAKSNNYNNARMEKYPLLLAVKMVLYAIPLAMIIFLLFPRTSSPLWGLPEDAYQAKTGLADEMSPGNISNLVNSQEVAFRVQFKSRVPDPDKMYWRGPVFWAFDGQTWSAPVRERRLTRKLILERAANPVEYGITLEPNHDVWLFALDQPGTIPEHSYLSTEMQLMMRKPINHLKRYEMASFLSYQLPWTSGMQRSRYLAVPQNAAPRARAYIHNLIEQHTKKLDLVKVILNRFSDGQYYYTRTPPRLSGDPTDAFLFDTKRGYCEHYASSFTVLMRLAGIPARVVTGYLGGERNPLSNYYIIRQSDAHAWSEIYLQGRGWIRIDPTAVIPAKNIENVGDVNRFGADESGIRILSEKNWFVISARQLQYAWDMVNNRWNQWVIGYSNQNQKSLFNAFGIPEVTWRGLSYTLFAILSIFVLLMAANIIRAQRVAKNALESIYQQFLQKLKPLHMEKNVSEGALSFSQRVARRIPGRAEQVLQIARLYNEIRYANAGASRLAELRKAVKSIYFSNQDLVNKT